MLLPVAFTTLNNQKIFLEIYRHIGKLFKVEPIKPNPH
jgi:hypothetical protein